MKCEGPKCCRGDKVACMGEERAWNSKVNRWDRLTNRRASRIQESITGISLTFSYSTSLKVPSEFPNILTCSSYSASLLVSAVRLLLNILSKVGEEGKRQGEKEGRRKKEEEKEMHSRDIRPVGDM